MRSLLELRRYMASTNLFSSTFDALMECDPATKVSLTQVLYNTHTMLTTKPTEVKRVASPGRPELPKLVEFGNVPNRNNSDEGMIKTIHAICHIEFNAINLALDAVYRFQHMPQKFYTDWLQVAKEEAYHFSLIREYLESLGYEYGSFDAHNGLWEMTYRTDYDPLYRMALVPRVLEARGLDVTPSIQKKFRGTQFNKFAQILDIIYRDEITHVHIGNYWYKYLCAERGLEYMQTFSDIVDTHIGSAGLRGPFNIEARLKAGFTAKELELLNA